ncbi:hypothetical protein JKA74_19855 [Marivirga sp. S37H4]|uniref:Uncharacterized protein n=1 Tax=Marivirga aurantiaca TaxID=2802615 RepID=A0A934X2L8_9BACT|nr:hypothetical protein [Marivirga aurantiaca]MBK6267307.1 hypothetical protein [Marivirga aurantiaca]
MKKSILIMLLFGLGLFYSNQVVAQISSAPTWQDGYDDGFNEGKNLALQGNYSLYQQFSNSYSTYPQRFPNEQQNYPYFSGKYVGLYYGWQAYYNPNPPGGGGSGGGGGGGNGGPITGPSTPYDN